MGGNKRRHRSQQQPLVGVHLTAEPGSLPEFWAVYKRQHAWIALGLSILTVLTLWAFISGTIGFAKAISEPHLGDSVTMFNLVGFWALSTSGGGNTVSKLALFDGTTGLKTSADIQPIPAETTFEKAQWSRGPRANSLVSLHFISGTGPYVIAVYDTITKDTVYTQLANTTLTASASGLPITYDPTSGLFVVADNQGAPGVGILTIDPMTGVVVDLTATNGGAYSPAARTFTDMVIVDDRIFTSSTVDNEILEFNRVTGQFINGSAATPTFVYPGNQFQWPEGGTTAVDFIAYALDETHARLYLVYGQQYRLLAYVEAATLPALADLIATRSFPITFSKYNPSELLHGLAWVPK